MYANTGQRVILIAHFVTAGAAAPGLTVTAAGWELYENGTKSPNNTTGVPLTVTEIGGGAYMAVHQMTADGVPYGTFSTAGVADVKSVPASALTLTPIYDETIAVHAAVDATPAATDALITASHGFGLYGVAVIGNVGTVSPATLDIEGNMLGRVMPYGVVTVYHGEDAEYQFTADADGDFSYELPEGSVWTLVARKAGYLDTTASIDAFTAGVFADPLPLFITITPATLDTNGDALGLVMPYGRVTVYHGEDAQYVFDADADGDYSYELPTGSVWTLIARHAGYADTTAEVSTEVVS